MFAKLFLTSLLAVLVSTGLITKSENLSSDILSGEQTSEQIMKAVMHNGEVLPYISLPVVEITAERSMDDLVTAEIVDGKIVPVIHLEEVIITPDSGMNSI